MLMCLFCKFISLREKYPNTDFFYGPFFTVFGLNTGKYGPEKTPYLDNFHAGFKARFALQVFRSHLNHLLFVRSTISFVI